MAQKQPTVPQPWTTANPTTRHRAAGHMTPEGPLLTEQADATWSRLPSHLLPPPTLQSPWCGVQHGRKSRAGPRRLCDDKQRHNRVSGRVVLWLCGSPTAQKISLHHNIFCFVGSEPFNVAIGNWEHEAFQCCAGGSCRGVMHGETGTWTEERWQSHQISLCYSQVRKKGMDYGKLQQSWKTFGEV